jgi:hypothetical protein
LVSPASPWTVAPVVSGFSRTVQSDSHQHAESEIGRGFSTTSLRSELGSMRARRVVESGSWADMKGQGSFENIDELCARPGECQARGSHAGRGGAPAPGNRVADRSGQRCS